MTNAELVRAETKKRLEASRAAAAERREYDKEMSCKADAVRAAYAEKLRREGNMTVAAKQSRNDYEAAKVFADAAAKAYAAERADNEARATARWLSR